MLEERKFHCNFSFTFIQVREKLKTSIEREFQLEELLTASDKEVSI